MKKVLFMNTPKDSYPLTAITQKERLGLNLVFSQRVLFALDTSVSVFYVTTNPDTTFFDSNDAEQYHYMAFLNNNYQECVAMPHTGADRALRAARHLVS